MPLGRRTFLLTAGAAAALPTAGLAWLDRKPPAWKAHWIHVPGMAPTAYGVCHFRRTFDLTALPAKFVVHVTGDSRYQLYCNGERVSWGPARGDLNHWHYETVDLAPKLKAGRNVLAALVLNDGPDSAFAQFSLRTGFLLQAADNSQEAVNTGKDWRCVVNEAYQATRRDEVGGYSAIGPMERFDAARYPWGWQLPEFDDSAWTPAQTGDQGCPRGQQDAPSRWMLVPRSIPMEEETKEAIPALRRVEGLPGVKPGALQFPIQIPEGTRTVLLLDQKKLTTAYPVLAVQGGRGATVKLRYSEGLFETKPPRLKGNRDVIEGKVSRGYADAYTADGNQRVYRTLFWRTFRYLQLEVETGGEPLVIEDLHGVYTGYPFTVRAKFEGGTPMHQRILDTGWHTARLCAHETYMDCPYYEQLQYVGDTRIQALVSLFMTGDGRLMRNAIELLDSSRTSEGATFSRAPSTLPQYIPPFSLWWIAMVHDYWRYVDDPAFVREMLHGTHAILDFYSEYLGSDHLLHGMPWWNFVDWVGSWRDGVPPMSGDLMPGTIQVQLLQAFQHAAELESFFGNVETAATWRKRGDTLWKAIQATFWDSQGRWYTEDAAHKFPSQHINSVVVLSGRLSEANAHEMIDRVARVPKEDKTMARCTVYFRYYLDRALSAAGWGDRYLERLGTWEWMLSEGLTTWAETDVPEARSDCHAWGASPNIEFFRNVLGVDSAGPGFSKVRIRPNLGPLQSARGVVPHPKGLIQVEVTREGGVVKHKATLPPGVTEVA
jgi:alpha-L-rhamnosidase